jgi:uncharacterized protein
MGRLSKFSPQWDRMSAVQLMAAALLSVGLVGCTPATPVSSAAPTMPSTAQPQQLPFGAEVEIAQRKIALEVAVTPQQQQIGLMYRDRLEDDRGMLFVFTPPRRVSFWMKNVRISLDMVFLYQGEVKGIAANTPPCPPEAPQCPSYGPVTTIDQVIELRGGRAAELGLKVGDRLQVKSR